MDFKDSFITSNDLTFSTIYALGYKRKSEYVLQKIWVKVRNPTFKGNSNTPGGGFQQGKKKIGGVGPGGSGFHVNKVTLTDVSITVPADRKVGSNVNKTNQIRDARDRLVAKNKVRDAREKLNQKAQNTDARQKLITIRSRKEPVDVRVNLQPVDARAKIQPVDARAKIQAKKQQGVVGLGQVQAQTATGGFTLTRTVANNNNSIQLMPGPQGGIQVTKTLTKVMPPGYEEIVGPTQSPQNAAQTKQIKSGVKLRLGPPAGPNSKILNITRTVSGNPVPQYVPHVTPPYPLQQAPPSQPYLHPGGAASLPYPAESPRQFQQSPPQYQQAPPPVSVSYGGAPRPPYPTAPLPGHYMAPPYQAPPVYYQSPPQAPPPHDGPPYPVDENRAITRTIGQEVTQYPQVAPLPVIQVENDQYRRREQQYPHYAAPPSHEYQPQLQPQYTYSPPQQQVYHPPQPADLVVHRTIPNMGSSDNTFVKTIVNDAPRQQNPTLSPLKRKSAPTFSGSSASGPLRLSSTNTVPVIAPQEGSRGAGLGARGSGEGNPYKYTRPAETVTSEPVLKKAREEAIDENDVISPLQGYKVVISNLHNSVSQDDVLELFGAIGAVKKVKLVKPGTAEVMYVKREDANEAEKSYHERELDGQPMLVKMMTPATAKVREAPEKLPLSVKPAAAAPLKFSKKPAGMAKASEKGGVEVDVLHKALFKSGTTGSAKPVTFTVNI